MMSRIFIWILAFVTIKLKQILYLTMASCFIVYFPLSIATQYCSFQPLPYVSLLVQRKIAKSQKYQLKRVEPTPRGLCFLLLVVQSLGSESKKDVKALVQAGMITRSLEVSVEQAAFTAFLMTFQAVRLGCAACDLGPNFKHSISYFCKEIRTD